MIDQRKPETINKQIHLLLRMVNDNITELMLNHLISQYPQIPNSILKHLTTVTNNLSGYMTLNNDKTSSE